jgi:hypothetical protein
MLFKAYPGTDLVKILWMLPASELWGQYDKGLLTENKIVSESIHDFSYDRNKLEEKEDDDMSDEMIDQIYKELSRNARKEKKKKTNA